MPKKHTVKFQLPDGTDDLLEKQRKELNDQLAQKQMHDDAKAGITRTAPGVFVPPEALAKTGD